MNTHLYKTIFNQMPASLSIKKSEELTENIMRAIQKVNKQTVEEIFPFKDYVESNVSYEDIIERMIRYGLQYQSVPVSEWIQVTDSEAFINSIRDTRCTFLVPVHENVNDTNYWDVITGHIDESGDIVFNDETVGWDYKAICYYKIISDLPPLPSSFLPKKPL